MSLDTPTIRQALSARVATVAGLREAKGPLGLDLEPASVLDLTSTPTNASASAPGAAGGGAGGAGPGAGVDEATARYIKELEGRVAQAEKRVVPPQ